MLLKYGLLVLAYLIGSIPTSVILGIKLKGIDVRKHGSGNPGGTNSMRFLGFLLGLIIMILDGLKAGIFILLINKGVITGDLLHPLAYGVAAALGHVYSIYIRFKGGKAVACTVGIMIAFNLLYAFIMMIVFFTVLRIWKYVSVSSTTAVFVGMIIGLIVGFMGDGWEMAFYLGLLFLLVLFRHKGNFKNIREGVEPKVKVFDKKKQTTS
jgi:glycerol-3-phosphate acyltransferase PlsY